jgi:hypothetical protein
MKLQDFNSTVGVELVELKGDTWRTNVYKQPRKDKPDRYSFTCYTVFYDRSGQTRLGDRKFFHVNKSLGDRKFFHVNKSFATLFAVFKHIEKRLFVELL